MLINLNWMHIANYLGPLIFVEVTICGMPHVTRVLKLFSKFAVFTLNAQKFNKSGHFWVGLHRILTVLQRFLRMFSKFTPCDPTMGFTY